MSLHLSVSPYLYGAVYYTTFEEGVTNYKP